MAIVLTFAFQAYRGIESAYQRVGTSPSRDRAARIVLDRLERELVGSVLVEREKGADPLLHPYFFFGRLQALRRVRGRRAALRHAHAAARAGRAAGRARDRDVRGGALADRRRARAAAPGRAAAAAARQGDRLDRARGRRRQRRAVPRALPHRRRARRAEAGTRPASRSSTSSPTRWCVTVSLLETGDDGQTGAGPGVHAHDRAAGAPLQAVARRRRGRRRRLRGRHDGEAVRRVVPLADRQREHLARQRHPRTPRRQVTDKCWNSEQPSAALQRLKVLMGGVPGFDAAECK